MKNIDDLIKDPIALLVPVQTMVIDLEDYACILTNNFKYALKDDPSGIYKIGYIEPILVDNNSYFTMDYNGTYIKIDDISKVNEAVYDYAGTMLLNKYTMKNKDAFLSNSPENYVYAYRAILEYIKYLVYYRSNYFNNVYIDSYVKCFKEEYQDRIRDRQIDTEVDLSGLNAIIDRFIKGNEWTMFNIEVKNKLCLVEKLCDYRVYDWTIQKYNDILNKKKEITANEASLEMLKQSKANFRLL